MGVRLYDKRSDKDDPLTVGTGKNFQSRGFLVSSFPCNMLCVPFGRVSDIDGERYDCAKHEDTEKSIPAP